MPGLVQEAINAELFKEQLRAREGGQHRPHSWTSCCMVPPALLPLLLPPPGPHLCPLQNLLATRRPPPPPPAPLQLASGFLSLFSFTADSEKAPVISVDFQQKQRAAFGVFSPPGFCCCF